MNNRLNEKQIGRYFLPADFKYLDKKFLTELYSLDFTSRISKAFNYFSGEVLSEDKFNVYDDGDFPIGVVSVDAFLGVLELTYGKTLCYEDYIFDKSSPLNEIYSLASLFLSAYCELVSTGIISEGDRINFSTNGDDGRLVLALYFLKKVGAPINAIIVGVTTPVKTFCKDLYLEQVSDAEVDEITLGVYEEADYLFDPISAVGMVCEDFYYDDYEDDCFTLVLGLVSPFLFSRRVLKVITGKSELSVQDATKKLYYELGEIPEPILNNEISPFYKQEIPFTIDDAISVING